MMDNVAPSTGDHGAGVAPDFRKPAVTPTAFAHQHEPDHLIFTEHEVRHIIADFLKACGADQFTDMPSFLNSMVDDACRDCESDGGADCESTYDADQFTDCDPETNLLASSGTGTGEEHGRMGVSRTNRPPTVSPTAAPTSSQLVTPTLQPPLRRETADPTAAPTMVPTAGHPTTGRQAALRTRGHAARPLRQPVSKGPQPQRSIRGQACPSHPWSHRVMQLRRE